jgi:hypothetical protein
MIFFAENNQSENFEEEEEEESGIDDELLGELDADDLLEEELDPLVKGVLLVDEEEDASLEEGAKLYDADDEEDEDVDDYDSFDDHDEM